MPWICSIYEDRPEFCRRWPRPGSNIPKSCGYFFAGDGTRAGKCLVECEASCCRLPRMSGDPDGAALPEAVGGVPCRYLEYTDNDVTFAGEKTEKVEPGVGAQPDSADYEE